MLAGSTVAVQLTAVLLPLFYMKGMGWADGGSENKKIAQHYTQSCLSFIFYSTSSFLVFNVDRPVVDFLLLTRKHSFTSKIFFFIDFIFFLMLSITSHALLRLSRAIHDRQLLC
jgi:hypothetical protein